MLICGARYQKLRIDFFCSSVFVSVCMFNVWPKTTLLPMWPRDAERLDTPGKDHARSKEGCMELMPELSGSKHSGSRKVPQFARPSS